VSGTLTGAMNVAQAMAHAIAAEGVRVAAGIAGQSVGHMVDALAEQPGVKVFYTRQERVAVDICDGHARASGRIAVAFTDNGPAAANSMGGLVNSWGDSVPLLFIAGLTDHAKVRGRQTKEIPFTEVFGPVCKWVATIDQPSQLVEIMRRAFMHLGNGRRGPVVIGLPYDVSSMPAGDFDYKPISATAQVRSAGDPASIERAVALLANAARPYVYVGSGVLWSEASPDLVDLAELLTLPVATTLNGKSAFPEDHPLSLGIGGFAQARYGTSHATTVAEAADVVLTIGSGFKQHATLSSVGKKVHHIQVDVDPAELNKGSIADVAILGDAKLVLRQLIGASHRAVVANQASVRTGRLAAIAALRGKWDEISRPLLDSDEAPLNPFRVTKEIVRAVDAKKTILLHDAGSVRGTTCMHYIAIEPRSFLGFGVQSAMGWSIGAAIGAKAAKPEMLVATVIGEEAFAETALDIETSVRTSTPILIIVLNNRAFTDRDGGVSAKLAAARFHGGVEIVPLARALGAAAWHVAQPEALRDAILEAIEIVKQGKTSVIEVMTRRVRVNLSRG
jgi:thiamine pyrophosphate-dependent acetolactate synthase large subunit-like protein